MINEWYSRKTYSKAYKYSMQLVRGKMFRTKTAVEPLEPPKVVKMPMRPRRCRRNAIEKPQKVRNYLERVKIRLIRIMGK